MKELERIQKGMMIYRIAVDANGFLHHQYRCADDSKNPPYNDGWRTDFMSQCCITVHRPYPYTAPSYYYLRRSKGLSVEEALA